MNFYIGLKLLVLSVCLGLAFFYDLKEAKIKNFITIPTALLGLGINFSEDGLTGALHSLQGWLLPISLLIILYAINVMGAGDIKLFAAIGALMGVHFALYSILYSIYIGGLIAIFLLIKRRIFRERITYLYKYLKAVMIMQTVIPYSPKEQRESKFIFTTAIVPGTLLQSFLAFYFL